MYYLAHLSEKGSNTCEHCTSIFSNRESTLKTRNITSGYLHPRRQISDICEWHVSKVPESTADECNLWCVLLRRHLRLMGIAISK